MSASRERPQTQDTNEIFNAKTRPKHVVKDELGGGNDEGEVGGAGSGTSFEVLFANLVLELQEMRIQIGVLPADAPAHLHVLGHTARGRDHGCRICCPKMCWLLSEHGCTDSKNHLEFKGSL